MRVAPEPGGSLSGPHPLVPSPSTLPMALRSALSLLATATESNQALSTPRSELAVLGTGPLLSLPEF